jgi:outer membrane protein assembly factor BamB
VTWRGAGTTTGVVLALPDRALVSTPDGTLAIDPRTGRDADWGTRLDALVGPLVHDDLIVSSSGRSGGFTAVDLDGRTRWTTGPDVQGAPSAARSCLVVTDVAGDRVSCVDWDTGETRWSHDRQGAVSVDGLAGQTDDDLFAAAPADDDGSLTLRVLDGGDGAARSVAELPGGAVPAATGRTVGYAFAYGSSGGRSTVVAFDRSSGERLWVYQGRLQVSFWAGVLVDVDVDGVAHELTVPATPEVVSPRW